MTDLRWLVGDEGPNEVDDVAVEWESVTALRQTTLTLGEDDTYNLVLGHTLACVEHQNGVVSREDCGYALRLALGKTDPRKQQVVFGKALTLMSTQADLSSPDLPLGPMGEKTFEALTLFMQEGRQGDLESVANALAAYYGHVPRTELDSNAENFELNESLGVVRSAIFHGQSDVAIGAARRAAPYLARPFADVEHSPVDKTVAVPWMPVPVAEPAIGPADGVSVSAGLENSSDPIEASGRTGGAPWIQPPEDLGKARGAFFAFPITETDLRAVETHMGPLGQEFHGSIIDFIDSRHLDDSLTPEEREKLSPLTDEQRDRQFARVRANQLELYRSALVDAVLVPSKFATPVEQRIALEQKTKTAGESDEQTMLVGLSETLDYAERMYQALCYLQGSPERAVEEPFLDGYAPWLEEEMGGLISPAQAAPERDVPRDQGGPDLDA